MLPTDLRDLTWETLQPHLQGQRLAVLNAWRTLGGGTTRQKARESGIDILTFRPRTTELYQMGLLVLWGRYGNQGLYRAVPAEQARAAFEAAAEKIREPQLHLL